MICLKRRGDRYYSYTVVTHHGSIVVLYQVYKLSIYLYLLSTKTNEWAYTVNIERIRHVGLEMYYGMHVKYTNTWYEDRTRR